MRGHSVGGFGSVTTNKVIATIGGEVFGKDVQAYPKYGSEKKGLPTTYYLTIADSHIYSHSELEHVDLVVLNDTNAHVQRQSAQGHGRWRRDLHAKPVRQPATMSGTASRRHHKTTDSRKEAAGLLRRHGQDRSRSRVGGRPGNADAGHRAVGRVSQAHALSPKQRKMSRREVYAGVEKALRKYFGKRGEQVVQDNLTCVKRGYSEMQRGPAGDLIHRPPIASRIPASSNAAK